MPKNETSFKKAPKKRNTFSKTNQPTPAQKKNGYEKIKRRTFERKTLMNDFYRATLGKRVVITGKDGKKIDVDAVKYLGKIVWDIIQDSNNKMSPSKRAEVILKLIEMQMPKEIDIIQRDDRFDSVIFKSSEITVETNSEEMLKDAEAHTKLLDKENKKAENEKYAVKERQSKSKDNSLIFKEEKKRQIARQKQKLPTVKL